MIFRRKPDRRVIRREYARLLYDLKQLRRRVSVYVGRLEYRISNLTDLLKYEDNEQKRRSYANAIVTYRSVLNKLKVVDVVLEYLITKIETISLLEISGLEVMTIKEVLLGIKDYITEFPEIELITQDLIERSSDLETFLASPREFRIKASEEAKRILETAKLVAESRAAEENLGV